jgi:hypothetical protein
MDRGSALLPVQPPIATVAVRAAVKTAYRMVLMTFPPGATAEDLLALQRHS